jgi:hypothetical protein
MRSWIEFLAAAGVCGTVALASTASFGQAADAGGAPPSVGPPAYYPSAGGYYYDVWPQWQYRGGPKSNSTTDTYYGSPNVYWYEGPNSGGTIIPR